LLSRVWRQLKHDERRTEYRREREISEHSGPARPDRSAKTSALRARAVLPAAAALAAGCLLGGCAATSSGPRAAGQAATSAASTPARAGSGAAGASPAASCASAGGPATGTSAPPALQAIQFVDQSHGWAAGAGRIMATSDGGRVWTRQYAGPAALRQVDFTDAAHGWALGQGTLMRTADGGATWTTLPEPRLSGHCVAVSAVHFVSPALGYAIAAGNRAGAGSAGGAGGGTAGAANAGGQLLRTTDGGVTWAAVPGAPASAQAVCFGGPRDGYVGSPGRIWRTTDGGTTWSPAFTEPAASSGHSTGQQAAGDTPEIECAGQSAAWVMFLGAGAAMLHAPYLAYATSDGRTWHGVFEETMLESAVRPGLHMPDGPGSEPGPFSAISPDAAAFVGYTPPANGYGAAPLTMATDGGATLNRAGDVTGVNQPLAAAFLTTTQGWVVGENLKARTFAIVATADAGRSWTTQYTTS
jgi:photosystem II stability/assembly factor-like uncharacterized protein